MDSPRHPPSIAHARAGSPQAEPEAKPSFVPGSPVGEGSEEDFRTHQRRRQSVTTIKQSVRHYDDGAFDGSFGGTLRTKKEVFALRWYHRTEYFTVGWSDAAIWRAAVIECLGTSLLIYLSCQFGITIEGYDTHQYMGYIGLWNTVLLAVFIYATVPASGGHLNPMVTFTTFLCGLCPLPRATMYLCAQTLGGALAGGMVRGSWGYARSVQAMGGGCFFDPTIIEPSQVLLIEIISCLTLLYLAIGVGIDPRQQALFGPQMGPILVGLSIGLVASGTSGIAPAFTGANMNPARALGIAVARGDYSYHWIWWVGPIIGSLLSAAFYNSIPPYHYEKKSAVKKTFENSAA